MKRQLFTLAFIATSTLPAWTMPVQRGWFTVHTTQEQEVLVQQMGDERGHWLEDASGHALQLTSQGVVWLNATELELLLDTRLALIQSDTQRRLDRHAAFRTDADFATNQQISKRTNQRTDAATTRRGLVILVDFADHSYRYPQQTLWNQFNQPGFDLEGHIGSVRDYFLDQSYGEFCIDFDVVGPYTLSQERSYYGQNFTSGNYMGEDMHAGEMVIEACQLADRDVDFSLYDWDGDREAEQVLVVYAGGGEHLIGASSDLVYPKEWTLSNNKTYLGDGSGAQLLDGTKVDTYAVICELNNPNDQDGLNGIGTPCHEFAHCLGLPDFYDTSYSGGAGMGHWDLLDYGSYNGPQQYGEVPCPFTAYERMFCGWLSPIPLTEDQTVTGMPCLQDEGVAYQVTNPENADQYYLLEYRQPRRWDTYTGGSEAHGMLICRVDYDATAWASNLVNSVASRQRMTYLPADGAYDGTGSYRHDSEIAGDLFPGTTSTTSVSLYGYQLTDIHETSLVPSEAALGFEVHAPNPDENPNDGLPADQIRPVDYTGSFLERSYSQMEYYACQDSVSIWFGHNGDSIYISNLQGYGTTVRGFCNWRTGELTFRHQVFLPGITMDNYDDDGNWLSADTVDLMFSADSIPTTVTGRLLSDGTIQLDQWLCESYFEGEGWDWTYELYMKGTTFVRPNAVMETKDVFGNSHTYNINIEYADDLHTALITGFGGKAGITVQVRSNGTLALEPLQYFYFYNFYYGYASLYYPTYDGTSLASINSIRYIHGTGSQDEWVFEPWCVCFDMGSNCPRQEWMTTSTTIRITDGSQFRYPAPSDYGWAGEGAEDEPYLLSNATDFVRLAELIEDGNFFDGIYFQLPDDIDFTGSSFQGIATNQSTTYNSNLRFEGHLDGAGHKISHLVIGSPTESHIALFGELRGTVSDLTIDETCSFTGYDYVGAFAGDMKTTTDARLTRCRNYAAVTGYDAYIGGLAGQMAKDHLCQSCYNAGTVTSYNCKVGGIVGYMFRSQMSDCQNDGEVRILRGSDNYPLLAQAGGLAGYACGAVISDCLNTGTVSGMAKVGGLVGDIFNNLYPSTLTSSINLGAVLCDEEAQQGTIVGFCTSSSSTARDVYYDSQRQYIAPWGGEQHKGITGITTAQLTSGTVSLRAASDTPVFGDPEQSTCWSQQAGLYPVLASHTSDGSDAYRHCLILFGEDETAGDLRSLATLAEGVNGELRDGIAFRLDGQTLTTQSTSQALVTDLLTLHCNGYTTYVPLRHLNTSTLPGSGTKEDPYTIGTTAEWNSFAMEANLSSRTYQDEYIRITNDLDFTDSDFQIPYQTTMVEFQGHLIGNGHTLRHIHADLGAQSTASSVNQGLVIAQCGKDGSIQELRLEDCSIHGYEKLGLFCGTLRGILMDCETDSLCHVDAENRYGGGLVGVLADSALVYNCENRASVWSDQFVGGIAGYSNGATGQIVYTDNYGHIYNFLEGRFGIAHVAGICPRFDGRMVYCDNYGRIESCNGYAAGLVCKAYNGGSFESCTNHGDVIDDEYIRITGYAAGIACEAAGPIVDCGNEGRIYSNVNYAGGITSILKSDYITDSWNQGEVLAGNVYAGGIASTVGSSDIVLLRCWNEGTVVAGYDRIPASESNKAGGIIGTTVEYEPILSQCWNSGEIRCDKTPGPDGTDDYDENWDFTDCGGLVGSGAPIIQNCFNAGRVVAKKQAGGLVGRMTGGSITQSYSSCMVVNDTLPQYASHLVGHDFVSSRVENCLWRQDADDYHYLLDVNYSSSALTSAELAASDGTVTTLGDAFDYSDNESYPLLRAFLADSSAEPNERSIAAHARACAANASESISVIRSDTEGAAPRYNLQGLRVNRNYRGWVIQGGRTLWIDEGR